MNTEAQQITTLFGGRPANVTYTNGQTETVRVIQLALQDYQQAFGLRDDEFAFTAFCVRHDSEDGARKTKEWILQLHPESYEALRAAVEEVNTKGFFVFAQRRERRESAAREEMVAAMGKLPPEVLHAVADLGNKSPSQSQSPRPRPMPS